MKRSEAINDLAAALSKAQAQIRPALKDAVNPHFKSKYADLASVVDAYREPLAMHGLSLSQHPSSDGAKVIITTLLMHTSGQWLESDLALTAEKATPQSIGSAISYGRRYSAMAITGMAADDDDGNDAEGRLPQRQASKIAPKPREPEPQAPPLNVYDGSSNMEKALHKALIALKPPVPEKYWSMIEESMRGKEFKLPMLRQMADEAMAFG